MTLYGLLAGYWVCCSGGHQVFADFIMQFRKPLAAGQARIVLIPIIMLVKKQEKGRGFYHCLNVLNLFENLAVTAMMPTIVTASRIADNVPNSGTTFVP